MFNAGGASGSPNQPTRDVLSGSACPVMQFVVLTVWPGLSFHIGAALPDVGALSPSATKSTAIQAVRDERERAERE